MIAPRVLYSSVEPADVSGNGWGWQWSVTNPSGLLGERNFVGSGKAWTRRSAARKANMCARRELRRLTRAERRRSHAGFWTINESTNS